MATQHTRSDTIKTLEFQKALETVEALPLEAQEILIDIINKRLSQQQRAKLVQGSSRSGTRLR
jgi:hypothetical protein